VINQKGTMGSSGVFFTFAKKEGPGLSGRKTLRIVLVERSFTDMMRKTSILLVVVLAIAFMGFSLVAFGLPKDKQAVRPSSAAPLPEATQKAKPTPDQPVVFDDDLQMQNRNMEMYEVAHRGAASPNVQAAVPYVDVRVGIPDTPGGNNHMRTQVDVGPTGVVHMVYGIVSGTPGAWTPADSAINFFYHYNAYDCSNSDALFAADPGLVMTTPGPLDDPRPRYTNLGGLIVANPATGVPIVYGRQYILATNTAPAGDVVVRGNMTFRDGAECLGNFSADTVMTGGGGTAVSSRLHPVMYALNESTWVATYRAGNAPSQLDFNYTTDRGLTWSALVGALPTYSPWFNSTDITGSGDVFYIVSHADPNDPSAFTTTERPCYLKGTYNPGSGAITFGSITDITGDFELPGFLANMIDIDGAMIGDTLHVLWTDWNNYLGNGFSGPGGHVHHAAVLPDGSVQGPHKVTNINIDGRLPDRSYTLFGFAVQVWPMVELVYGDNEVGDPTLYALWSAPPDDGNFGWADYNSSQTLAVYDIFCSSSPNNGRAWDEPNNITMTNNPGCTNGTCFHEDFFSAAPKTANDTIWVTAFVQKNPGVQESAIRSGIPKDPGLATEHLDSYRLYKAPAREPVVSLRGDLDKPPSDTTKFFQIAVRPRAATPFSPNVRLSNIGLVGFTLDSITIESGLNDGFLVTTENAVPGTFVPVGGAYDFQVSFNSSGVGPADVGARSGLLRAYIHSVAPAGSAVLPMNITVYVVPTLCLNRKAQIHSGSNYTDIGNQGSIKDQGGLGMHYFADEHDNFYDGGVWLANSGLNGGNCASGPRKVSRQIFGDKFLRCLSDGILDSTMSYVYCAAVDTSADPDTCVDYDTAWNISLASVATDAADSTLVYKNLWEQSTHPESSDFLIQTTKVINIGNATVDSVSMGVIYDVDVDVFLVVSASENVGLDTTVNTLGRDWWLGAVAGNDVAIDTCTPGQFAYGFVVVPTGDTGSLGAGPVRPRGGVVYEQAGFSYELDCGLPDAGDSLFQRYAWTLDQLASTRDRNHDTLTGVYEDTLGGPPDFICGDRTSGPPWRADMGYMTVAKKVYNFPVNDEGALLVSRFGLNGLVAGMDSSFRGPGETYTVIHVASSGGGISDLMANAVTAINWWYNHASAQAGPYQGALLRGDHNNTRSLSPADAVLQLNRVFLGAGQVPVCVADLNLDGATTPADVVILLNGIFLGSVGPGSSCEWCLTRCP
jgi:hypothetical protein